MIKYYCDYCLTIVKEPTTCTTCGKHYFTKIKFTVLNQSNKDLKMDNGKM